LLQPKDRVFIHRGQSKADLSTVMVQGEVVRPGKYPLGENMSAERAPLYAYLFQGEHYDAGNKLGFVQATIAYALKDPELAQPLQTYWEQRQPSKIKVAV